MIDFPAAVASDNKPVDLSEKQESSEGVPPLVKEAI
jgi:hypothetical protein